VPASAGAALAKPAGADPIRVTRMMSQVASAAPGTTMRATGIRNVSQLAHVPGEVLSSRAQAMAVTQAARVAAEARTNPGLPRAERNRSTDAAMAKREAVAWDPRSQREPQGATR